MMTIKEVIIILSLLVSILFFIVKSAICQNLIVTPENPQAGQQIQFQYDPVNTPLSAALVISATAYIMEETGRITLPVEIPLIKKNSIWHGEFELRSGCVAYALTFKDKRDIPDTNVGKGYIFYLKDKSGATLKGAKAVIAKYYSKDFNLLMLEIDMDKARSLFEKEFEKHDNLKQYYIRPYHYTFDLNDPQKRFELISELDKLYEKRDQFDEITLNDIAVVYSKLLLKDKADDCRQYIIEKYPNGEWAFIFNSFELREEFRQTLDLSKKLNIYKRMDKYLYKKLLKTSGVKDRVEGKEVVLIYNNKFTPSFSWINNEIYYHSVQLTSLVKLLGPCWDGGQLNRWWKLVESIENEWVKTYLYDRFSIESISRNENIEWAFDLSSKAVDWTNHEINNPTRTNREKRFYNSTDSDLKLGRKHYYARTLITKGELLLRLNKLEEAKEACDEVIENSNLVDIRLNDRIVELLLNSGYEEEAKDICKIAISKGKASDKMKKLIQEDGNEHSDSTVVTLAKDHIADKKAYLESIRKNTPAANFDLINIDRDSVSFSDYKGKIVVLNFWATWCAPCRASFPAYQEIIEKYKAEPEVEFLFINIDKYKKGYEKKIKQYLAEKKFDFEVLLDAKSLSAQSYAVSALPTKFVIDKTGTINFRSVGVKKDKEEMIEELSLMIEMAKSLN